MRRELPIAITLIAAGIALWAGRNGELNRALSFFQNAAERQTNQPDSPDKSPQFLPASSSNPVKDDQSSPLSSETLQLNPISLRAGLSEPNAQSKELLKRWGQALGDSAAFKLDLVAELNWQSSTLRVSGQYAQRGQGTGQSRIDLLIGTGAEARTLSKICDGRFLYSLQQADGVRRLQFIDLKRIQETRLSAGFSQPDHPTSWIALGGFLGFLENVGVAFQFSPPQFVQQDGLPQIQIDGVWNPDSLRELLKSTVPQHDLNPRIVWENLPQHVPHQLRLIFVQHQNLGWLPHEFNFFRFVGSSSDSESSKNSDLSLLARIAFSSPQQIDVDEAGFLQLNTDDVETIDNTPLYISQVKKYEMHRQAQGEASSLIR